MPVRHINEQIEKMNRILHFETNRLGIPTKFSRAVNSNATIYSPMAVEAKGAVERSETEEVIGRTAKTENLSNIESTQFQEANLIRRLRAAPSPEGKAGAC